MLKKKRVIAGRRGPLKLVERAEEYRPENDVREPSRGAFESWQALP